MPESEPFKESEKVAQRSQEKLYQIAERVDALRVFSELGGDMPLHEVLQVHVAVNNGHDRAQQEEMLKEVSKTLSDNDERKNLAVKGTWGFIEAGTGTGKSYAYLIPAAFLPGRYLIATSTNQLSEQLAKKDLPAVQRTAELLGESFKYEILKGKSNYVCKLKVEQNKELDRSSRTRNRKTAQPANDDLFASDLFGKQTPNKNPTNARSEGYTNTEAKKLNTWIETTKSGERSDIPFSVSDKVWNNVSIPSNECLQSNCPFYKTCFAYEAVRRSRKAKIVVTNHAYLAHMSKVSGNRDDNAVLFSDTENNHIDSFDSIIIDEAHDFTDAVSNSYAEEINTDKITKIMQAFRSASLKSGVVSVNGEKNMKRLAAETELSCEKLADLIQKTPEGQRIINDADLLNLYKNIKTSILKEFANLAPEDWLNSNDLFNGNGAKFLQQIQKVENVLQTLNVFINAADDDEVVIWSETAQNNPGLKVLKLAKINVGEIIWDIFSNKKLIATSATLTFNNSFSNTMNNFGVPLQRTSSFTNTTWEETITEGLTIITKKVDDVFHYKTQGILYIPKNFPEPVGKDRTEHIKGTRRELVKLIEAIGGRTLALFTTTKEAKDAADLLREKFPHLTILKHGESSAGDLVRQFVENETSILCATMGLWQGVDAPGPTCSLVFINKVAFPPPSDVLNQAKVEKVEKEGVNGFMNVVVPAAAQTLAQASGRLIRSEKDKGVVAITDPRLVTKRYGEEILNSLPNFTLRTERETVLKALTSLKENIEKSNTNKNGEDPRRETPQIRHTHPTSKTTVAPVSTANISEHNNHPPRGGNKTNPRKPAKKKTLHKKVFKKP